MCSPWSSVSSPVLTMAVIYAGGTTSTIPRRSRAAPTPPARAAIIESDDGSVGRDGRRRVARAWRRTAPGGMGAGGHREQASGPIRWSRSSPAMCKARSVPPERSAPSEPGRLSVGFDATPLLGRPTGVGAFCAGALVRPGRPAAPRGVGLRGELAPSAGHRAAGPRRVSPPGSGPCRPARCTRRGPGPVAARSSGSSGRHDVVHGTNFVVPPTRRAARVVTVHDLTVVLYPELCDRPTLAVPRPHPAGGGRGGVGAHPVAVRGRPGGRRVRRRPGAGPGRAPRGSPACAPRARSHGRAGAAADCPTGATRYVLAIGTVEPRKDYPLLVRAFDAVAAAHPDVALVVVGADGWGAERFDRRAWRRRRGRDRIVRPGYLDDRGLAPLLAGASAVGLPVPSTRDSASRPLQAMAAGVPVVATAAGAVPEVVGDGAVLVEPGDGDGLAGALVPRPRRRVRHRGPGGPGTAPEPRSSPGRRAPRAWPALPGRPPTPVGARGSGRVRAGPAAVRSLRLLMWSSSCGGRPRAGSAPTCAGCSRASTTLAPDRASRVELVASRSRRPGRAGSARRPVGHPVRRSLLPGPVLTRAWDHGLLRRPAGVRRGPRHLAVHHGTGRSGHGRHRARPAVAAGARGLSAPGPRLARGGAAPRPAPGRPVRRPRRRWWPTTCARPAPRRRRSR